MPSSRTNNSLRWFYWVIQLEATTSHSLQILSHIRPKILSVLPSDCVVFNAGVAEIFTISQFGKNDFIGRNATVKERGDSVENTLPHGRVSAFFLVIKDDEQYSVARIATCRLKTFPSPKVTNIRRLMCDTFGVGNLYSSTS
jgi:hypothetical protein